MQQASLVFGENAERPGVCRLRAAFALDAQLVYPSPAVAGNALFNSYIRDHPRGSGNLHPTCIDPNVQDVGRIEVRHKVNVRGGCSTGRERWIGFDSDGETET